MESLAYSIVELLRGSLPWSQLRHARDACVVKQLWSGSDLCAGYPPAFGEFLDDAQKLKFDDRPDYDLWISRFQSLSGSGSEVMDRPIGVSFKDALEPGPSPTTTRSPPPSTVGWMVPAIEEEDYSPHTGFDLGWARFPTTRDQIGNEKETVRKCLARIEEVPETGDGFCCLDEAMVSWEEEDQNEEEHGKQHLESIDD